jgi:PAS domain S-box-containing protein
MSKINILVVDDRPEGILAVQAVLTDPEYNLITASSGSDALKSLLSNDFAVILMDVQMPIMNGFDTAEMIKTREKSRDIPIIFMSAINQDEAYVYQGYKVGAVDYLLKPFDPFVLRSKVAVFVNLYRQNKLIQDQAQQLFEKEVLSHAQSIDKLEIESLKRYQHLANAIPEIVCRFYADGSTEYFNKSWYTYTGLIPSESLGLEWQSHIHPEDLHAWKAAFSKSEKDVIFKGEARIKNRLGSYRWHLWRMEAETHSPDEDTQCWIGTAIDIEDRKRSEDTQRFLAEAGSLLVSSLNFEENLKQIAELSIPYIADWCCINLLDSNDNLRILASAHSDPSKSYTVERLIREYDASPQSSIGARKVAQTGIKEVYETLNHELLKYLAVDSEHYNMAKELDNSSAIIIPLKVQEQTIGVITFAFSHSRRHYDQKYIDVTEELSRRIALSYENSRLYELSQQAIQVRNDFLSIASHELNTPITSLKMQLQMTQRILKSNIGDMPIEKFGKQIASSVSHTDRLINLVQVLLDVSRIQSGKFAFNFEAFKIDELIKEIKSQQNHLLGQASCELDVLCEPGLEVNWDKTRIEQVLTNLITNVMKYAPGKISLSVSKDGEDVHIKFKDFGPGIPKNKVDKIFDRFERATSDASVGGLGLGLYIVKEIIEGHQGRIDVETGEGKGTEFTIHLPMKCAHDRDHGHIQ